MDQAIQNKDSVELAVGDWEWCSCGDGFESNSFGAGFLAAAGQCENCQGVDDCAPQGDEQGALPPPTQEDWLMLAASLYQAAGKFNMPVRFLDALSEAAAGKPFAHHIEGLLPVTSDENGVWDNES